LHRNGKNLEGDGIVARRMKNPYRVMFTPVDHTGPRGIKAAGRAFQAAEVCGQQAKVEQGWRAVVQAPAPREKVPREDAHIKKSGSP
jgi:hypothetical protein